MRIQVILSALAAGAIVQAAPLDPAQLSDRTTWMLHLDVQALVKTQLGARLANQVFDTVAGPAKAELKRYLDLDFDWRRIRSLTAYGVRFLEPGAPGGVLLVDTDLEVREALERAIAQPSAASGRGGGAIRLVPSETGRLYVIQERLFAAVAPGMPLVLSPSKECVELASSVLAGQATAMESSAGISGMALASKGCFLVGAAKGFNESAPLPPRAQVLRQAEAAQILAKEEDGRLSVQVALRTRTEEISRQIRQILQGLMALALLGDIEDPALRDLARSVDVSASDRVVTVRMSLPVKSVIENLEQKRKDALGP